MTSASHRLGRRTSHLAPLESGRRGSVTELLAAATDPDRCAEIAYGARMVVLKPLGQQEVRASNGADLVVDELRPTRRPPSYRGMRNYIGRVAVPSAHGPSMAWFESLNELTHIRDLLLTESVGALVAQPALVVWDLPDGPRYHYPDLLVRRHDSCPLLCDVTRRARMASPKALAQFALMAATAAVAGWEFQLRSELPPQRVHTQSALYACRGPHKLPADWEQRLGEISWPSHLHQVAAALDRSGVGMASASHLIATRRLYVDFDAALSLDTPVHRTPIRQDLSWLLPI